MKGFDDIFKKKLAEHESAYSPEVWQNISNEIFTTPKKPIYTLFNFWFVVGASIGAIALASYFIYNSSNADIQANNTVASVNEVEQLGSEQNIDIPSDNEIALIQGETEVTIDSEVLNLQKSINSINTKKTGLDQKEINTSIQLNRSSIFNSKNVTTTQLDSKTINTNELTVNEASGSIVENLSELTGSTPSITDRLLNKYGSDNFTAISEREIAYDLRNVDEVPALSINAIPHTVWELTRKPQQCPRFYKNVWVPYSWVEYGSIFPIRTLASNSADNVDYADLRDMYENPEYSFDAAAGFGMKSPKGVVTEVGIQYTQLQEKFNYTDPESVKEVTVITIDTTFNGDGTYTTSNDTSFVDLPGARTLVTHNKYKFVSFPFMLGYEHNINSSFSVAGKAGVIVNFSFRQKGNFLDEQEKPVAFSSNVLNKYEAFKSRIGLSYMAAAQLNYHFTGDITLFASPQVKIIPGSITLESYSLKQTYINPALTLGIKYSL